MGVILRKAKPIDFPILKTFEEKLIEHERPLTPTIRQTGDISYYNIQALIDSPNCLFLIAEVDGLPIGCGFGEVRESDSWSSSHKYGYIGCMFIDLKYRNMGAGKAVLDEIIKWFRINKVEDIRLKVYSNNLEAIALYRKAGFQDLVLEMVYS